MSDESPMAREARLLVVNSYAQASQLTTAIENAERGTYVIHAAMGSGKSWNIAWLLSQEFVRLEVRNRLRDAGEMLRNAVTRSDKRAAVRKFLEALTELLLFLVRFFVSATLLMLSYSISRVDDGVNARWKPPPMDTAPQITPRGPNSAFPVLTYRGGHYGSALGSAVLAA
ncbi:hypothetical protein [Streptomyces sp. NPDC050507]|uniref:hypothetical protein n=1 Tax=Streptomyces sp. NPDC050507 TaxID=3365619 RepID=UPI0037A81E2D